MTLMEVLVSSLVLATSSTAALGVWNQAAVVLQHSTEMEQKVAELEMQRLASHRWLAEGASAQQLLAFDVDRCRWDPVSVSAAADAALPLPQRITRRWHEDPEDRGLWLELSLHDDDGSVRIKRHQLLSPFAFGLCQP